MMTSGRWIRLDWRRSDKANSNKSLHDEETEENLLASSDSFINLLIIHHVTILTVYY